MLVDQLVEAEEPPRRRRSSRRSRTDRHRSRRRRRRSCSRPTPRHPRRRRRRGGSSRRRAARMRRKIRCDCTGEPPGELIDERDRWRLAHGEGALERCAPRRPASARAAAASKADDTGKPHHRHDGTIAARNVGERALQAGSARLQASRRSCVEYRRRSHVRGASVMSKYGLGSASNRRGWYTPCLTTDASYAAGRRHEVTSSA